MGLFYTLGKPFRTIKNKVLSFLHNNYLKEKLNSIIFGSDTPAGKFFDVILFGMIILSVIVIILESMSFFPPSMRTFLRVLEWVFTAFFTFEYIRNTIKAKTFITNITFSFFEIRGTF